MPKAIALIGNGAIAQHVRNALAAQQMTLGAIVMRPARLAERPPDDPPWVASVANLPAKTGLVIDCAGHAALRAHGPGILAAGHDLLTVSLGALADAELADTLTRACEIGGTRLHLASGAIGALDALRAAATRRLDQVRYVGRKPPAGWRGSPAEDVLDLSALTEGAETHFEGTARVAAERYPKNANVAAAVALAGVGFDETSVELIADAGISANIHELHASGDFGNFSFRIEGTALPDNPRSSALAAMSVLSALDQRRAAFHF